LVTFNPPLVRQGVKQTPSKQQVSPSTWSATEHGNLG